jgi:hypothetical protein
MSYEILQASLLLAAARDMCVNPLNDCFGLCVVWKGDYDFFAVSIALSSGACTFLTSRFGFIAFHTPDSVDS